MIHPDTKEQGYCGRCDYRHPSRGRPGAPLVDGTYSPSGFVVLSSGELECPTCEGMDTDEHGNDCDTCEGGVIRCEHRTVAKVWLLPPGGE